jgi:uncharacterized protein YndB with AHSA1/START domain
MLIPEKKTITVSVLINSPVERVWELWTVPHHNLHWNSGSPAWNTTRAENNLVVGGKFLFHMEAKDGSAGFDFEGEYSSIIRNKFIGYTIADGRIVNINFVAKVNKTEITESFEAESLNPPEMQKAGWQHILDNFKKYAEKKGNADILHFDITIKSDSRKVFKTMLDEKTYKVWTSVFNPTSRFEGSWEKRSKIVFLGTDNNGEVGGMISRIRENIPGRFLSIEHLGIVNKGKEVLCGPEVDSWKGALENYTFASSGGSTVLSIDIDSNEEFRSYFLETWPTALEKLKSICE